MNKTREKRLRKQNKPQRLQEPNFYDAEGKPFLVRCPECKRENYGPAVATGACAWCGFEAVGSEKLRGEA